MQQPQAWQSGGALLGAVPATEAPRPAAGFGFVGAAPGGSGAFDLLGAVAPAPAPSAGGFSFIGAPAPATTTTGGGGFDLLGAAAPAPSTSIYSSDTSGFNFIEPAAMAPAPAPATTFPGGGGGFDLLGAAPAPSTSIYSSDAGGVDLLTTAAPAPTVLASSGAGGGAFGQLGAPSAASAGSQPPAVNPCSRCYVGHLSASGVCTNPNCSTHESSIYGDASESRRASSTRTSVQTSGLGPSAGARSVRINRARPGRGLGIVLKTSSDGHVICTEIKGAAAAAGVVAGSRVMAVAGVSMEGQPEGAVVAAIQGLSPGSPVDLVLAPPAPNWQATLPVERTTHAAPSPGPATTVVQITIPPGVVPGQQLRINAPNGEQVMITAPQGCLPGQQLQISLATAAVRSVRINRAQPGTGLGIVLKTSSDGHVICTEIKGAAAAAGVVAGSRVMAVAGVSMEGQPEGAVVAAIQGLSPGSPVDLVLAPPAPNWQATLPAPAPQPAAPRKLTPWEKKQAKELAKLEKLKGKEAQRLQAVQAEAARLAMLPLPERAALARASPQWIPDAETSGCMICAKVFGTSRFREHDRRQHCRYCGWAVCGGCSQTKLPLQRWMDGPHRLHTTMSTEALRVCRLCDEAQVHRLAPERSLADRLIIAGVTAADHLTREPEPGSTLDRIETGVDRIETGASMLDWAFGD